MDTTHFRDTRGGSATDSLTFTDVVVKGIAHNGGLFIPEDLPHFSLEEVVGFANLPYWQRAATIFKRFGVDLPEATIDALMQQAYGDQWDDEAVAPVVEVRPDMHVLELWHGPTQAFKDMALQCMPLFFSAAVDARRERGAGEDEYLILVATSGDTGKAALEGFADRKHTSIIVFYPADGVSDIQRKQMVTQRGDNVGVYGVRGNFDDCQTAVKQAFADSAFNAEMGERGIKLSSANSINFGRLLPQVVYYLSAYADMVASGGVKPGEPMDVCVPTGNFGNILGAYYAKLMGVPLGRLICASNENRVLSDFIASGLYDISDRPFVTTPSPSMDILISSNLERLLYHLAGSEKVTQWMAELAENRRFQVDPETYRAMRELFIGDFVTNEESLETIRRIFDETGYLLDPHTAVAWEVAERTFDNAPILVVSTAHWAKFGTDVLRALLGVAYDDELPEGYAELSGLQVLGAVTQKAIGCSIVPKPLADLATATERFSEVVDAGREGVEQAARDWLSAR